jgi:hypothetical protein
MPRWENMTPEQKKAQEKKRYQKRKEYYAENKDKRNAQRNARYAALPDEVKSEKNKADYKSKTGWYAENRARRQERSNERYAADENYRLARLQAANAARDRPKEYERELRREYELNIDDYRALVTHQKNKCAICHVLMILPHVDHCHESGFVRGLLCKNCNNGLGMFKDDLTVMLAAVQYLKRSQKELPEGKEALELPESFIKLYYRSRKRAEVHARTCPCGVEFEARRSDAVYCSKHCKARADYRRKLP